MYLGSWKIDDALTFTCNTHAPATGAATDDDSTPTYRVYEDETGTAILNGNLAKLDDANTTGFYSEQITLSAANGLEKGKTYTIYIAGTVGGVTGTMSHTFQIEAEVDANIVSDKTGYALADTTSDTVIADAVWNAATGSYGSAGSYGLLLETDLDAAISTRAPSATALSSAVWTGTKAGYIDAAITSRAASATALSSAVWTSAKAGYLTAAVATATALATAQTDLDTLTGTDGVTLATAQANYAPATATALATAQTDLDTLTGTDGVTLATSQPNYAPGTAAELAKVPKSDGTSTWNSTALASINAEVDTALNTAIPGSPTADSINERVKAIDDLTQASGDGDLAAILVDTDELQGDWENTGRLDTILDTIATDTTTDIPGTITTMQSDVTAIKAKTDNLPDGIKKNTAFTAFTFVMVDSSDHVTGKTGLTVAGSYSGDGGAVAALTNTGSITEISNGLYEVDLTSGELNYSTVTLIFTASGADARIITIHPST